MTYLSIYVSSEIDHLHSLRVAFIRSVRMEQNANETRSQRCVCASSTSSIAAIVSLCFCSSDFHIDKMSRLVCVCVFPFLFAVCFVFLFSFFRWFNEKLVFVHSFCAMMCALALCCTARSMCVLVSYFSHYQYVDSIRHGINKWQRTLING